MKRKSIRWSLCLLCLLLLLPLASASAAGRAEAVEQRLAELSGCSSGKLLQKADWVDPGSSVSDWLVYTLALNGVSEDYSLYLKKLEDHVTHAYAQQGCLHSLLATEYHRTALTVLALGGDPTSFGKDKEGRPINLVADGTWGFSAGVGMQGLNGLVFALILLDTKAYSLPPEATLSRESLLVDILSYQNGDGGFGLQPGSSDVDMTAMTLTALAPYKASLAEPVSRALDYLSQCQQEDGSFVSYGAANAESTAQVLIALCSLGLNPEGDARFCKGEANVKSALESFCLADGTFCHALGEGTDFMATQQVLLALTAYDRLQQGAEGIYSFQSYQAPESSGGSGSLWLWVGGGLVLVLAAGCLLFMKKRRGAAYA